MKIEISDHFTLKKLLIFTFPSILMMLFTSIYIIADGYFVSNYAGKTSLAAVNFAYPVVMIMGCIGFMFGTGGSALISKRLGEQKEKEANNIFSMIVIVSIVLGLILQVLGFIFMPQIASLMGAKEKLLEETIIYGRILLSTLIFYILQYEFQCLMVTAGKPKLGLYITVLSGLTNVFFDWLFIAIFKWGIVGGAIATSMSQIAGGLVPFIYFCKKNNDALIHISFRFSLDKSSLFKTISNGCSEFLGNISSSLVGALYNLQLLKYLGEDGIAAYGVIMYVNIIFFSIFIGYSVGVAPVISYNYGAKNKVELKSLVRTSFVVMTVSALFMYGLACILAMPLARLFVGYDKALTQFTYSAFNIFALSFLFCGFSGFSSSLFTALNNGIVSGVLSVLRLFVFQALCVIILPLILGAEGIWYANVLAEVLALIVSIFFVLKNKKRYGY